MCNEEILRLTNKPSIEVSLIVLSLSTQRGEGEAGELFFNHSYACTFHSQKKEIHGEISSLFIKSLMC